MPTKRHNQTRRKRRRRQTQMRGGCLPCMSPLASVVGIGGLAGVTMFSRSSSRTKNGKMHTVSETRVMKHKNGEQMSIRIYEKDGDLTVKVGSKNFKVKSGETRDQVLQRAIKHCEKRGYRGCADTSKKRRRTKKRHKRS